MRTGAIFARGSCRALKWMAVFGVVFALGAGTAAAQVTVTGLPDTVTEGSLVTLTVGGTITIADGAAIGTVAVSAMAAGGTAEGTLTQGEGDDLTGFGEAEIATPANATGAVVTHPVSGTFDWQVGVDGDAEDEAVVVTFTVGSPTDSRVTATAPAATEDVTINDNAEQTFVWSPATPTLAEGGASVQVTLTAVPDPANLTYNPTLALEGATGYTLATTTLALSSGSTSGNTTITSPTNDGNRTDDTIMLRALMVGTVTNLTNPLSITVTDLHELPEVTVELTDTNGDALVDDSAAEGTDVTVTFSVATATTEDIKIALSRAPTSGATTDDYTLSAMDATIAAGGTSESVTLTLAPNDDIGDEMLVLEGEVTGDATKGAAAGSPVMVALTITDATVKQVFVKDGAMDYLYGQIDAAKVSDGMLNPDDDFSVDNDMLFGTADGYTVQVDARSSMSTVASVDDSSGDSILVMPESVGTAMVTLTATALPEASSFMPRQLSPSVATIEFEVVVEAVPTAAPDTPAAPTVATGKAQGALDVSWTAPNDNGSAIMHYGLRYKMSSAADWTVMSTPVTGGTSTTLTGLSAGTSYDVQVNATNAVGTTDWSKSGDGKTADPPPPPARLRGQITALRMMTGPSTTSLTEVNKIRVGGTPRYHTVEGDNDKWLAVTVQWRHEELLAIAEATQYVNVEIKHRRPGLPIAGVNWVSWIDEEGDADFPQGSTLGRLQARVSLTPPKAPDGSARHVNSATGYVRVLLPVDQHEAENDAFFIEAIPGGDVDLDATAAVNLTTPVVIIEDQTPQEVTVIRKVGESSVIYEGAPSPASSSVAGQALYTVSAKPARIDLPLEVRMDLLDPEGAVRTGNVSLSHSAVTLNPGMDGMGNSHDVYLALPIPDGDRVDNGYTLQASVVDYSLTSGGEENTESPASVDITVYDRHKIPTIYMVNPTMANVAEGDTVDVTVTVNRNPADTIAYNSEVRQYTSEELLVTLSPASSEDFRIMTNPVKIGKHDGSAPWTQAATFTIEAITDDDIDMDTVTLDIEVAGTVAANGSETREMKQAATVNITDETEKLVWAKTNDEVDAAVSAAMAEAGGGDGLNPGEVIEILGVELFGAAPGVVVDYAAASSDTAVATGSGSDRRMITVTPMAEGMAMVTVTATATSASGATIVDQTKPNVAQIMFSVDVMLRDLTFMVMGPDEMNLVEGGMGGMVKVMTNRPVTENTEVMLMRDGSSSASDMDYDLNPSLVTIMAGEMEGSTMVAAVEDNMAEDMEMLTLFLVVDGMQMTDESVSFNLWDAAVPALPVIAQLLLAAFLAVGGYRRYRRR